MRAAHQPEVGPLGVERRAEERVQVVELHPLLFLLPEERPRRLVPGDVGDGVAQDVHVGPALGVVQHLADEAAQARQASSRWFDAALAPVHRKATANAKRLSRRR